MGRPKEKTESVRVDRELMRRIRVIAAKRGAMVSWMVNKAISLGLLELEDESR